VRDHGDGNPGRARFFQTARARDIGDDKHDPVALVLRGDQALQIAATPGNQDRNALQSLSAPR